MSHKISLTAAAAKKLNLKRIPDDQEKPEPGIELDGKNDGEICYIGPCTNGFRPVYYVIDGQCVRL